MSALIFCVEASEKVGMGHLMRCLAIAQAAESHGVESWFVVPQAMHGICRERHDWSYGLINAAPDSSMMAKDVLALAEQQNAIAIILDGYHFSASFAELLIKQNRPLVVIDDIFQEAVKVADVIVNAAGEDAEQAYRQLNPSAHLCLGATYRLLRREFSSTIPLPHQHRHTLALNLGGSDPKQLTLPILKALARELPDALIRVITGPGFRHVDELADAIATLETPVQHIHNCQDMADVWSNARLAVSAAGGSQFELAACMTPAVMLIVAENQRRATEQATQQYWCTAWDATECLDIEALATEVGELWYDGSRLEAMHNAAQSYAEVDGAERVLHALMQV